MFVTKTLEDPLRRVPLLAVNRAILFQNAVDDIRERRQLRALRRLASPISRRFRMQQYLGNRLAVDPELARSFPSAQTLTMTRQSHSSIKIHSVHPPPSIRSILTKAIDGPILVRRRNRTNRPLHWGIIAPPFSFAFATSWPTAGFTWTQTTFTKVRTVSGYSAMRSSKYRYFAMTSRPTAWRFLAYPVNAHDRYMQGAATLPSKARHRLEQRCRPRCRAMSGRR